MDSLTLFLSHPGWERPLADELQRVFPNSDVTPVAERWFAIDGRAPDSTPSLAFALQTLPNAERLPSISIRKDADAVARRLRDRLADCDAQWRLQVFASLDVDFVRPGKAKLFHSAILEALKRTAKGSLRRFAESDHQADDDVWLVQTTWINLAEIALSVCDAAVRRRWRRCLSPWSGGVVPIRYDRRPPSRAYRKLLEALAHIQDDIRPGETVVELGASPGGWTFVALDKRACVVAVDRAPLRDDLMVHRRLQFQKADAFKFAPNAPVDWLLADLAAYPERTLELVRRWLANGWCRKLIATVKFVGGDDYGVLALFKATLVEHADDFRVRKLVDNKNEVAVMAWRARSSTDRAYNP